MTAVTEEILLIYKSIMLMVAALIFLSSACMLCFNSAVQTQSYGTDMWCRLISGSVKEIYDCLCLHSKSARLSLPRAFCRLGLSHAYMSVVCIKLLFHFKKLLEQPHLSCPILSLFTRSTKTFVRQAYFIVKATF